MTSKSHVVDTQPFDPEYPPASAPLSSSGTPATLTSHRERRTMRRPHDVASDMARPERLRTPQEKKALSLDHDCRNVVAESQWGARDAIAKRKQWVNQSYRKAVRQTLSALSGSTPAEAEAVESTVAATQRHRWRKFPDVPLRKALRLRRSRIPRGASRT